MCCAPLQTNSCASWKDLSVCCHLGDVCGPGDASAGMKEKAKKIHVIPPLAELSGTGEGLVLGGLEFTYRRKILQQQRLILACW